MPDKKLIEDTLRIKQSIESVKDASLDCAKTLLIVMSALKKDDFGAFKKALIDVCDGDEEKANQLFEKAFASTQIFSDAFIEFNKLTEGL